MVDSEAFVTGNAWWLLARNAFGTKSLRNCDRVRQHTSLLSFRPGESLQRALAQHVLDQLDDRLQDIHILGHSFGGQAALDIALIASERVRSLTMICSRDTPYPPFGSVAAALRRGGAVDINAAMSRQFRPEEAQAKGSVVKYARPCLQHADRNSCAAALEGIAKFDRSLFVSRLDLSVTLIAAEFDHVSQLSLGDPPSSSGATTVAHCAALPAPGGIRSKQATRPSTSSRSSATPGSRFP